MNAFIFSKTTKSPCSDGLTSKVYKLLNKRTPFLYELFVECLDKASPNHYDSRNDYFNSETQHGQIIFKHLHRICLPNNDYKIFALLLATRLKMVLDSIIEETQSDFMTKRHRDIA